MAKSGHHFPSSAGFKGSTGKVQSVKGYTRATPMKKAGGGIVGRAPPPRVLPAPVKAPIVQQSSPKMPPKLAPVGIAPPPRVLPDPIKQIPRPVNPRSPGAYADGGYVMKTDKIGDQGNSVTKRGDPYISQADSEHGGSGALRTGFAKGGKAKGHGSFNKKPMFGK